MDEYNSFSRQAERLLSVLFFAAAAAVSRDGVVRDLHCTADSL